MFPSDYDYDPKCFVILGFHLLFIILASQSFIFIEQQVTREPQSALKSLIRTDVNGNV